MKILMVNRVLYPLSAVEGAMLRLAGTLEAMGHEIMYFVREHPKNLVLQDAFEAPLPAPGEDSVLKAMRRLLRDKDVHHCLNALLQEKKPDCAIVYQVNRTLTYTVLEALHEQHIPAFVMQMDYTPVCPARTMTHHDAECRRCLRGGFIPCMTQRCLEGDLLRSFLGAVEQRYLRYTRRYSLPAKFLTPSAYHQQMMEQAGFTDSPVACVNLQLPQEAFDHQESTQRGDYLLYVGSLVARKGLPVLLHALSLCVSNAPLIIVGDGPDAVEMKRLCERLNLQRRVEFRGHMPARAVRQMMARCLCLVTPSQCEEIGPWSLLEALALGKPAIVSDYGVLPERVLHEHSGLVFPAGDSLALAQCIDEMTEVSDQAYEIMCTSARDDAARKYHPHAYAEHVLAEINSVR